MSRVLTVTGTEGSWELDYSELSIEEIERRIKVYEEKHGGFEGFLHRYDCDTSTAEEFLTLMDWESLLDERKQRMAPQKKTG